MLPGGVFNRLSGLRSVRSAAECVAKCVAGCAASREKKHKKITKGVDKESPNAFSRYLNCSHQVSYQLLGRPQRAETSNKVRKGGPGILLLALLQRDTTNGAASFSFECRKSNFTTEGERRRGQGVGLQQFTFTSDRFVFMLLLWPLLRLL